MTRHSKLTPMMAQYRRIKSEIPDDTLLLFRMGDFYEIFFDDAIRGSQLLDITLTRRAGVPMAGIPYHALRNYIPKIVEAGVKAAIAEQVEDPKKATGIVKREITQVITPGTIVDGDILMSGQSNYLVCIAPSGKERFGIAGLDISTGEFRVTEVDSRDLLETEMHRLRPAECLISESLNRLWRENGFPDVSHDPRWTAAEDWTFDRSVTRELLNRHFGVVSLDGFGCRDLDAALNAAGAVLYYAQTNLRRNADHVTRLSPYSSRQHMIIDRMTQRNLELIEPLFSGAKDSTLLSVLNKTITPMGGRLLREWIVRPLVDVTGIENRSAAVAVFVADELSLSEVREVMHEVKDMERIISRLNVGAANARDLLTLRRALTVIPGIKAILGSGTPCRFLRSIHDDLTDMPDVCELIANAIEDEPPLTIKEGGMIRKGYHPQLDELRRAATDGKSWIADLQRQEQDRTGIRSLKVRFNKVFGYYIEVTKKNLDMVPNDYIRKQTLVNAERFITPALKEMENKILGAEDKSKALEYEIFQDVRAAVISKTLAIQGNARQIAVLDVIASLAEAAVRNHYTRPTIRDDMDIHIRDGRHPVVDSVISDQAFVPNDTFLNDTSDHMLIITGPNMAGKSTYIRQVALLTLMAQIGSFIPARSAEIGIVDRIFTRIGAADDLSRGQSTFMVEMLETANILNNATPGSLIILDEVGRGTSTFDGLSIAWAIAEYLNKQPTIRARTLFATHYHELTELAKTLTGVKNYNIAVKEDGDSIRFMRKIVPGAADKSYGIHVARLAGLPQSVIDRANEVLMNLQGDAVDEISHQPKLARKRKKAPITADQPTLFEF